jgi:hypothetical protein
MKFPVKFTLTLLIIILLSIVGSLAIYFSTNWGPWAFSDSTEYIDSARNLLAGRGLGHLAPSGSLVPLTLHPPFYPLVLSALGLIGFNLLEAARWLNIFLFGATIFLSGSFTYALFHSSWLAISLSAAILTIPPLIDVSSGAMSELLFLFTATLGICLLIIYLGVRREYLLILSSIAIGLSMLSRYPGVVAVITCLIGLLVTGRISWKQRIRAILKFSLISITPSVIWVIWIYSQTRTLVARDYHFTLDIWSNTIDLRRSLMEIFWSWLPFQGHLPSYSYNLARNVFLFFIGLIFLLASLMVIKKVVFRKSTHSSPQEFTCVLLWMIFIIGNISLLAASFLLTSPVPDLNPRTLLPVQFGLVIALITLLASIINEFRLPSAVGWTCAVLALIFILPNARTSWKIINQYHIYGGGYTSQTWHSSLTLQELTELPLNIPIITNQSAAVLLLTERPAYDFCPLTCNQSGQLKYGDDPRDPTQNIFREEGAALVFFYPYCGVQNVEWYANTLAQLKSLTQNLRRYFSSCDGEIFFYPSAGQN